MPIFQVEVRHLRRTMQTDQVCRFFLRGACTRTDCHFLDLQVIGCGESGVRAVDNATITLSGQGTSIQGNGTKGSSSSYGLKGHSSSTIRVVHPLTKEQISTSNGGGGNWGGDGVRNIKQISNPSPLPRDSNYKVAFEKAQVKFLKECRPDSNGNAIISQSIDWQSLILY